MLFYPASHFLQYLLIEQTVYLVQFCVLLFTLNIFKMHICIKPANSSPSVCREQTFSAIFLFFSKCIYSAKNRVISLLGHSFCQYLALLTCLIQNKNEAKPTQKIVLSPALKAWIVLTPSYSPTTHRASRGPLFQVVLHFSSWTFFPHTMMLTYRGNPIQWHLLIVFFFSVPLVTVGLILHSLLGVGFGEGCVFPFISLFKF